jgi:hypothetical protein
MVDWKHEITQRLAELKLEPTGEAEIVEELAQHLEDRYQELRRRCDERESVARGASRVESERDAATGTAAG